jgi:hypothetical protein
MYADLFSGADSRLAKEIPDTARNAIINKYPDVYDRDPFYSYVLFCYLSAWLWLQSVERQEVELEEGEQWMSLLQVHTWFRDSQLMGSCVEIEAVKPWLVQLKQGGEDRCLAVSAFELMGDDAAARATKNCARCLAVFLIKNITLFERGWSNAVLQAAGAVIAKSTLSEPPSNAVENGEALLAMLAQSLVEQREHYAKQLRSLYRRLVAVNKTDADLQKISASRMRQAVDYHLRQVPVWDCGQFFMGGARASLIKKSTAIEEALNALEGEKAVFVRLEDAGAVLKNNSLALSQHRFFRCCAPSHGECFVKKSLCVVECAEALRKKQA